MAIQYDTHLHSDFSTDSSTQLISQINEAKKSGLHGIVITDHYDYDFPKDQYPEADTPFVFSIPDYLSCIKSLQKEVNTEQFQLYTGIELGLQNTALVHAKMDEIHTYDQFDYFIGSVHLIDKKDPYYPEFWQGGSPHDLILKYFEQMLDNITAYHNFDALGHLDYIVRYAPEHYQYQPANFKDVICAILELLIQKEIALEINTSGIKSTGMPNPHTQILQWYQDLHGSLITIGSDAHSPEFLAYRFDLLNKILQINGFREYVTYEKHKPNWHYLL